MKSLVVLLNPGYADKTVVPIEPDVPVKKRLLNEKGKTSLQIETKMEVLLDIVNKKPEKRNQKRILGEKRIPDQ